MTDAHDDTQAKNSEKDRRETAQRIKYWRKQAGLKQKDLALIANKSASLICRWESEDDEVTPSSSDLCLIARGCRVSMRVFWADMPTCADVIADEVLG